MAAGEAREWYEAAVEDLREAAFLIDSGWYPDACFHAQQAAEKALKAFLRASGIVARTHRLSQLARAAEHHGLDLSGIREEELELLAEQYMAPRYPNFRQERGLSLADYTEEFARRCLSLARDILRRVERCLRERGLL